jgi:hypothetical protein
MGMAVVAGCSVLLLFGVLVVVLWGSRRIQEPIDAAAGAPPVLLVG